MKKIRVLSEEDGLVSLPGIGSVNVPELWRRVAGADRLERAYVQRINELEADLAREEARVEAGRRALHAADSNWIPPRHLPPQLLDALNAIVEEYFRAKAAARQPIPGPELPAAASVDGGAGELWGAPVLAAGGEAGRS